MKVCKCCGRLSPRLERHHVFFKRSSDLSLKKWLDDPKNISEVCPKCHGTNGTGGGKANSYFFKVRYWDMQCESHGSEAMMEWYKSVPLKIKDKYW